MKLSKMYMPTMKQDPKDADVVSARFLLRAGMIRKNASGIYSFLPMGLRVLRKIEAIVREEMDAHGGQEVLMSALQPKEIWEASGRWTLAGSEMFKVKDRNGRDFCLGPTHEEYFTSLIKDEVNSYKQLPLNLYQIQTKFRDERRPRFGLIRSREFLMKDAYSFDETQEGMEAAYRQMWDAYDAVFSRLTLTYKVVRGDSGNMGGSYSHEFHAVTPNGETTMAICQHCGFAETDEMAKCLYDRGQLSESAEGEMVRVHTPDIKTIEDLEQFFDIPKSRFIKTLLFKSDEDKRILAVLIPGDRALNLVKLARATGIQEDNLEMLTESEVHSLTGSYLGFVGPYGLKEQVELIADQRIFNISGGICGANEKDWHLKNVRLIREAYLVVEDLLQVEQGDLCPSCGKELRIALGTEVGNIFQLGVKYSESMGAFYLNKDGKSLPFYMGSYGIGISRCVSAVVEQYHDDKGICWPTHLAPYQIMITVVNHKKDVQMALGQALYNCLKKAGYEVLLDDRNVSAGIKFTDRDLIGIPIRINVGRDADEGLVEYSLRVSGGMDKVPVDEVLDKIESEIKG